MREIKHSMQQNNEKQQNLQQLISKNQVIKQRKIVFLLKVSSMPPQKKKSTKVQTKNQQKIVKVQGQIEAVINQNQIDDIESNGDAQIQYDDPIDDDIQENIAPKSSPQKFDEQSNHLKCRKRQAPNQKLTTYGKLPDDAPLRQQPQRTRRQVANQSDTITSKQGSKSDSHTEVLKTSIHTMTRNSKKKENLDSSTKNNEQKESDTNSPLSDEFEYKSKQSQLKQEDIPLRQQKNNQHQLVTKNEINKSQNSYSNNTTLPKQQQIQNYQSNLNQPKQQSPQQQQANLNKSPSNITDSQILGNSKKILGIQNEASKDNIGENKALTLKEIEGLNKLLSIQVDGIKIKEQQMQNMQSYKINNNNINNNRTHNSQNSLHLYKNNNYHTSQYSINNLPQGQNPRKMIKQNNDNQQNQQQLIQQQRIINERNKLKGFESHIVIDEEFEDDIENQCHEIEDNILEDIHEVPQLYSQGIRKQYTDQNIPQRSVTPQNKTHSYQNPHQIRQQQNINGSFKQQQGGYSDYNPQRVKNINPIRNANDVGKFTPIYNNQVGKITPMNQKLGNLMLNGSSNMLNGNCMYTPKNGNGKFTPMNENGKYSPINGNGRYTQHGNGNYTPINNAKSMNSNGKTTPISSMNGFGQQNGKVTPINHDSAGGKRTPIAYGNSQQQVKQQEIENEIQLRIETIKNNIGPLLACLNSDYIGTDKQNNQQQQQIHLSDNKQDNNLKNKIYQDMRERRMNTFDRVSPNIQIQQQGIRGRSVTPTVQGTRQFDQGVTVQNQNTGSRIEAERKITPIRGFQQQQPFNQIKEINSRLPIRSYDTRNKDWVCGNCKNFNQIFQKFCNRCGKHQDFNQEKEHSHMSENVNSTNQNNYQEQKKTPIRTVSDVKRTFQDIFQNKENLKNIQNLNNNQINNLHSNSNQLKPFTQKTYQRGTQVDEPIFKTQQEQGVQAHNNKRQRITYKDFQNYENSLANKSNFESYSGNKGIQNSNKESSVTNEVVGHKIVFIDNSSAEPNQNSNDQLNSIKEVENKSHTDNNNMTNNNQKQKVCDPRIQIR